MRKRVWILNHYATDMMAERGGRHYWLAQEIQKKGYEPVIFASNVVHNSDESIDLEQKLYKEFDEDVKFVLVKSTPYQGNGMSRIKNMLSFTKNVIKVGKQYAKNHGKPDIIYASSVHPLTLLAGEKLAKFFKVPCICEVRDLWPLTLVAYGAIKETSLIAKILYRGERYLYKKADAMIFTMAGGKQYIIDRGWDNVIDTNKVYHINNGVDLKQFQENCEKYTVVDDDLLREDIFKIVYTGSIRRVNNLGIITEAAKLLKDNTRIKILIWGAGDCVEELKKEIEENQLTNIEYKGIVKKQQVPYILSHSDVNLLHSDSKAGQTGGINLLQYGMSQNKLFEYLASGKPILSTMPVGFSLIEQFQCGVETQDVSTESIAKAMRSLSEMSAQEFEDMRKNAQKAAQCHDFEVLANKLIQIIEGDY